MVKDVRYWWSSSPQTPLGWKIEGSLHRRPEMQGGWCYHPWVKTFMALGFGMLKMDISPKTCPFFLRLFADTFCIEPVLLPLVNHVRYRPNSQLRSSGKFLNGGKFSSKSSNSGIYKPSLPAQHIMSPASAPFDSEFKRFVTNMK